MASITFKDIPEELLDRLRKQAAIDKRSVNKEAMFLLDEALQQESAFIEPEKIKDRVNAQAEAWRILAGRWQSSDSAATEIESIYKARSEGREVNL